MSSVPKYKRTESSIKFLDVAKTLKRFTIQQCIKLPKRYTFFGLQQTVNCVCRVKENIKKGNSIFPSNQHEVQMRRDCFLNAMAELYALTDYIDDIRDTFPIKDETMVKWINLITEEQRLLKSVLTKDKERYNKANFK